MSNPTWMDLGPADLKGQVNDASRHVDQLAAELARATDVRDRALKALQALQALVPEASSEDVTEEHDHQGALSGESQVDRPPRPAKRVKSTELVTNAVASIERPVARDELYAYLESNDLIPAGWERPRNAFNTALGRAVERGQLVKRGDQYAVPDASGGVLPHGTPEWLTGGTNG